MSWACVRTLLYVSLICTRSLWTPSLILELVESLTTTLISAYYIQTHTHTHACTHTHTAAINGPARSTNHTDHTLLLARGPSGLGYKEERRRECGSSGQGDPCVCVCERERVCVHCVCGDNIRKRAMRERWRERWVKRDDCHSQKGTRRGVR